MPDWAELERGARELHQAQVVSDDALTLPEPFVLEVTRDGDGVLTTQRHALIMAL
jgi:hypothetical protein